MYEDILLDVRKPGQYIGREWNVSSKDFDEAGIKFALSFPDLYEIGMSNLGLRIIYGILNNIPDVVCERVFAVEKDLEAILRLKKREVLSLESRRKLIDFDLLGFSLGSELNYTNVLNIMDLGGMPLRASLRDEKYPLVIGGGPCSLNPEPMHEFFDIFVIGEAEDLIVEIINLYRKFKKSYRSGEISKDDLLLELSKIKGVYVPSFYEVGYNQEGGINEFKPKFGHVPANVEKRIVSDFNRSYYPEKWLVPNVGIVHDRITLEIMRGCPNRCRFCQARSQYFPLRYRDVSTSLELADNLYRCTGYDELSLSGLSVSDHPQIEELLKKLSELFKSRGVSLSLPSVKAKSILGGISSLIAEFKKTGLTFAPEAGSEKLRNLLAKDFNTEDFFKALKESYNCGYQHVKLYFMIGLPQEGDSDLDAIIDFSSNVSRVRKDVGKPPAQVNISINNLIPKPHTALQWSSMQNLESIRHKQEYIRNRVKREKRIKLSFHEPRMSFLEGILSRGDRKLAEVISLAFKNGARLDAWGNYFNFDLWDAAFKESGVNPEFYLKEKTVDEVLPWDFIDTGIDKSILVDEFNKSIAIQ
jgi:radical SAM family uncharacterized protein